MQLWPNHRASTELMQTIRTTGFTHSLLPRLVVATVTDSDYTFTNLPSGKTVKVQIITANDAGEAQPSVTAEMVVP